MPGGAAAIRQPWRMTAAYLDAAYSGEPPAGLTVAGRNAGRWQDVVAMARRGINAPPTSSAGRLFDAVAALLGVRDTINYEGQAAIELEQWADPAERGAYPAAVEAGPAGPAGTGGGAGPLRVLGADLVRAAAEDLLAGAGPAVIAARFHRGVAAAIAGVCTALRERSGLGTVALSGGVFQNLLLLGQVVDLLEQSGFRVLTHARVPPNDGGISLGQAAVAGARDRRHGGEHAPAVTWVR